MGLDDFATAMDRLKGGEAGKIVLVPWGETGSIGALTAAAAATRP